MIKRIRVLLSILILILLALLLLNFGGRWISVFTFLKKIQFIPALLSFAFGITLFWLVVTYSFGRVYCSSVCPIGTFQDIISRLKQRNKQKTHRYSTPRNTIRYSMLLLTVGSLFLIHHKVILLFDPYTQYQNIIECVVAPAWNYITHSTYIISSLTGMIFALVTLIAVSIFSYSRGRLFCNTICPVGCTLSIVSRHSIFQFEVDTDLCTHCNKCIDNCKSSCIKPIEMSIDTSRCVMCFNCIDSCNDNAIRYTASRKRLSTPLMQSLNNIPQVSATNFSRGKQVSTIKNK